MIDSDWHPIQALLEEGWPGAFDDEAADAYRVLLGGRDPGELVVAIRLLVEQGARYRPTPAEICAALNRDTSKPTWPEAYRMIFGPRGVIHVRDEREALSLADELHPFVGTFVRAQGLRELRLMPLEHPDYGGKVRADLGDQWARHCERCEERLLEGRALEALGRAKRSDLIRFDPRAALARAREQLSPGPGQVAELQRRSSA